MSSSRQSTLPAKAIGCFDGHHVRRSSEIHWIAFRILGTRNAIYGSQNEPQPQSGPVCKTVLVPGLLDRFETDFVCLDLAAAWNVNSWHRHPSQPSVGLGLGAETLARGQVGQSNGTLRCLRRHSHHPASRASGPTHTVRVHSARLSPRPVSKRRAIHRMAEHSLCQGCCRLCLHRYRLPLTPTKERLSTSLAACRTQQRNMRTFIGCCGKRDMLTRVNPSIGLPHRDFVDERVPLDRDHDVRRLDRALGGVVGPGDGEHGPSGPDAEP